MQLTTVTEAMSLDAYVASSGKVSSQGLNSCVVLVRWLCELGIGLFDLCCSNCSGGCRRRNRLKGGGSRTRMRGRVVWGVRWWWRWQGVENSLSFRSEAVQKEGSAAGRR